MYINQKLKLFFGGGGNCGVGKNLNFFRESEMGGSPMQVRKGLDSKWHSLAKLDQIQEIIFWEIFFSLPPELLICIILRVAGYVQLNLCFTFCLNEFVNL